MNINKKIALNLLKIGAVFLRPKEPFTWVSGIKSPIYCDNRIILSFPEVRTEVELALAQNIRDNFPDVEVIAGTATAGIPHAAIVAHLLNLPMVYVKTIQKSYGRKNTIEGKLTPNCKAVVLEDLISTGLSSIAVVNSLKNVEVNVLGVMSIFTYDLKISEENFKKNNIILKALCSYNALIELALKNNNINNEEFELLKMFQSDPTIFSESVNSELKL
ncbi:MAG: orotate phosphoribosyltransferase [Candidatus Improbicoccus devescovinae]|nr:MAG: orotate phosphoribosyltransferase [Candidatus Improbicoccus devescovinae]